MFCCNYLSCAKNVLVSYTYTWRDDLKKIHLLLWRHGESFGKASGGYCSSSTWNLVPWDLPAFKLAQEAQSLTFHYTMTATSHLHSWLENVVHNYWGKKERLSRVIYKVQVSENDYDTLETQLTDKFPDRHCQQYDSSRNSQTSDNLKLRCLSSLKRCQEDDNEDEDTDSFTILDMQDIFSGIKGPFSLPVILVRKEYRVFRKLVMAGRYNSFVTGQPGIGG